MPDSPAENPFQSPAVGAEDQSLINTGVASSLRATRPWVLFLAILGVVGIGFMVLGTLGMAAAVALGGPGLPSGMAITLLLFYLGLIACYLFPVVYLFRFASRIQRFLAAGTAGTLQDALAVQKSVWKSLGIAVIAGFVMSIAYMATMVVGISATAPNFQNQNGVAVPMPVE
ncbi:hypothetical protein KOR34_19960 [Posidoniimonas corsicana]|uniref:Uncharacterized protein n=1 Tax=Posidoniimonas corsicana TaxID=1938618 RepID=A0A5C5VGM5_9BACT|nr:hypothetical protein [Posidoniimonas corsicana]TWT37049.1 hypothetical protein KOR34_19960 [Posidoniimonas corsicana]